MKVSDKGLLEICEHEGIVPAPYRDSVGVLTFGIGHTHFAGDPDPRKMSLAMPRELDAMIDYAIRVFREDVQKYEARVNKALNGVPLKQHQFDALVSWDFNTGGATWRHPKTGRPCQLIQQLRSGDYSGDGFMGWTKPPEIRKRRVSERKLFRTGNYDANGDDIPVWQTNGDGDLRGIFKTMQGSDILIRMRGRPDVEPRPRPAPRPPAKNVGNWWVALCAILKTFRNGRK